MLKVVRFFVKSEIFPPEWLMKKEIIKRNPQKTRSNILKHATSCFAKSGYHGTALDDILAKAKVNKRMVYHYFGNKFGLYREVHLKQWKELQNWFAKALSTSPVMNVPDQDKGLLLKEALSIFHDFVEKNPVFLRLLIWDGIEGGKISKSLWKDVRGPIYQMIETLVLEAQEAGAFPKAIRANHFIMTLMGGVAFYFSYASTMIDIFHQNPLKPEAVRERKEQMLELVNHLLIK